MSAWNSMIVNEWTLKSSKSLADVLRLNTCFPKNAENDIAWKNIKIKLVWNWQNHDAKLSHCFHLTLAI